MVPEQGEVRNVSPPDPLQTPFRREARGQHPGDCTIADAPAIFATTKRSLCCGPQLLLCL